MHKKKFYFIVATAALVISAAAFIGGRFLNQRINPSGTISVNVIPAAELPATSPEATGPFIERREHCCSSRGYKEPRRSPGGGCNY